MKGAVCHAWRDAQEAARNLWIQCKRKSRLLGISNSYLSEIEHGKKQASIELLERYAEIFDIRLSSLLRFSEEYGEASNQGAGQRFITKAMSKLIDSFSASHEA